MPSKRELELYPSLEISGHVRYSESESSLEGELILNPLVYNLPVVGENNLAGELIQDPVFTV